MKKWEYKCIETGISSAEKGNMLIIYIHHSDNTEFVHNRFKKIIDERCEGWTLYAHSDSVAIFKKKSSQKNMEN